MSEIGRFLGRKIKELGSLIGKSLREDFSELTSYITTAVKEPFKVAEKKVEVSEKAEVSGKLKPLEEELKETEKHA